LNALAAFQGELAARLEALGDAGLRRRLTLPSGIDFSSNDYLGFARDRELARAIGDRIAEAAQRDPSALFAPASRLLRGETALHREVEERLARFKGTEAALVLPSGYQANVALLTAILGPDDLALSDELNHASLIDGLRLSGCRRQVIPHLELAEYERALGESSRNGRSGRTVVIVESLFSMDGDAAPLGHLADLCDRHGALLGVDDAHAARGSGLVEAHGLERRVAASVFTFGKALAVSGACIAGSRTLIDWVVNRARPFIFSTAVSPLLLVALAASLDHLARTPERRGTLHSRAAELRRRLRELGLPVEPGDSPIVPVLLGSNERALAVAEAVRREGFDVRAVRPPTVPQGTARLRISVHADHSADEIERLAVAIGRATAEVGA
jgi:8-amino-7-oxononanoate synthase